MAPGDKRRNRETGYTVRLYRGCGNGIWHGHGRIQVKEKDESETKMLFLFSACIEYDCSKRLSCIKTVLHPTIKELSD